MMADKDIQDHQQAVLHILSHLNDEASYPKIKPKMPEKDFARENIIQLRHIQKIVQRQETENIKPMKSCDKYKHITSKVSTYMQPSSKQSRPNSHQTTLSRFNVNIQDEIKDPTEKGHMLDSSDKLKKPSEVSRLQLKETNYIKINASNVACSKLKRCSSAPEGNKSPHGKHKPGILPKYLIERQRQLKEQQEQSKKESSAILAPSGHRIMPEEERRETLELLKKNEHDLLCHLTSLPVHVDTLRMKQHKEDLERQLAKIEEGIKIFSRLNVFIKADA